MDVSTDRLTRTATLLFTDLVGSSAATIRLGPEADAFRRLHFSLLRGAVAEAGGREVKTLGDGLMVVFDSATGALSCAVAMQRAVHRHNRRKPEPLLVRIGISLGDVVAEEGDLFGVPVIEAARLCAAASAGQILLSGVVRLVAREGPGQHFVEVGPLELKGFGEPVSAWEVQWQADVAEADAALPAALARSRSTGWFVGREGQLQALRRSWERAISGQRQATLLCGEPGAGKTRLAAEHALAVQSDHAIVLYGRCEPELRAPFAPFISALKQLVADADGDLLVEHVRAHGGELTRLVPDLADRVQGIPAPSDAEPDTELYRLVNAVIALCEVVASRRPLLLIVEDVHWADRSSLRLVLSLIRSAEARMQLVVSYRDVAADQGDPLREALGDLVREPRVERLALTGLDDEETVQLLEAIVGHPVGETGRAVARSLQLETEGNALFTTELVRNLAEAGVLAREGDGWRLQGELEGLDLPDTLRDVITTRVQRLGSGTASVLRTAAVIGRSFEFELLARVIDEPESVLLDALEAAQRAAFLSESRERPGRFSFTHALVAHALAGELGGWQRQDSHRRIAAALEGTVELEPERVGEMARHLLAAGDTERGTEAARLAGDQALQSLAPDEATRWYRQALTASRQRGAVEELESCELLIRLGEAERRSGTPGWGDHLLAAAEIAERRGDAERLARAALANNRGMFTNQASPDQERVGLLQRALEAVGESDSPYRARLLATLASELWSGDHDRRVGLSREALETARRLDDRRLLADVAYRHCLNVAEPATLQERLALTAELLELARAANDPVLGCLASAERGRAAIEAGDLAEGLCHAAGQRELAAVSGNAYARHIAAWSAGWPLALSGRYAEAERAADAALAESTSSGQPDAIPIYSSQIFIVRRDQGRLGEFVEALATLAASPDAVPAMKAHAALALLEADRAEEAYTLVAEGASAEFPMPVDAIWLTGNVVWGEACARVGHTEGARILLERLLPWRDQIAFTGFSVYGAVSRVAGLLAGLLGDARCNSLFQQAEERHLALEATALVARTRLDWGEWLGRTVGPDGRVAELLRLARDGAASVGCVAIVARAEGLLGG